ncbi:MAG TPA: hypothetical protein VEN78_08410 [Bradyrhizobium sp.]|nr:hypothetical protein [Bradyrhizobium sp.]
MSSVTTQLEAIHSMLSAGHRSIRAPFRFRGRIDSLIRCHPLAKCKNSLFVRSQNDAERTGKRIWQFCCGCGTWLGFQCEARERSTGESSFAG